MAPMPVLHVDDFSSGEAYDVDVDYADMTPIALLNLAVDGDEGALAFLAEMDE
jgi:hypothetical protein